MTEPKGRTVGGTEYSWCKAAYGGTGVAVVALLTLKPPNTHRLQTSLHKLQNSHPILRSTLLHHTSTFSFLTSPAPFLQLTSHDLSSNQNDTASVSPLQQVLELELNNDTPWRDTTRDTNNMFFGSVYALPNNTWVIALRLHVAACDRTTAVLLLRELLELMEEKEQVVALENDEKVSDEISLAMEDLVPREKTKKAMLSRGFDMLGYSLNSLRLTNLKFHDTKATRFSQVVRLQLSQDETKGVLAGCAWNGIKVCGVLSAAGLMAAHCSKRGSKKYGVVTLTDCRSIFQSRLSDNYGFYHSAILNSHEIKGGETLWNLAKKTYGAFSNSKKTNKHFSDMADLNFLMCKAIENPGLTSSSSLRTAFMSVFEDTVVDNSCKKQREIGVEDYLGCASVHGVGPSIAIFDTIRDGNLDCVCVYPAPLHSREQMNEVVGKMKDILVDASKAFNE
ncbi:uncharacterized protein LOC131631122 [Vicia villosa]|uniref:uncharacterized protein LOC131631122 n=1 Tax=Vicia villosa TaxID=3911 RepID=UPI00273A7BD3|nr:uncharacterized protein LOC131631122 [Vicia villosa]